MDQDLTKMLDKLAWVENVFPTIAQSPATKKITERLVKSTVRNQYITNPTKERQQGDSDDLVDQTEPNITLYPSNN